MDFNLAILSGRLAAPPELREFESGSCLLRSLIAVRSDAPRRRVDVIPVTLWNPDPEHLLRTAVVGDGVWVAANVQRRFWSAPGGRMSKLEVVAHHVELGADQNSDGGPG